MKNPLFFIALVLIAACASYGQSRSSSVHQSRVALADQAWQPFFADFRTAVNKRDRVALREMIATDFFYTIGHHASDQREAAFAYWDEQKGSGWKAFSRVLAKGAVRTSDKSLSNSGEVEGPMRVAPPAAGRRNSFRRNLIHWYAVFEFRSDGRWYCITFIECCD